MFILARSVTSFVLVLFLIAWVHQSQLAGHCQSTMNIEKSKTTLQNYGPAIVAAKNIMIGDITSQSDFKTKMTEINQIPKTKQMKGYIRLGQKMNFSIREGDIVSSYDFDPPLPIGAFHAAIAKRNISKGEKIENSDYYSKVTTFAQKPDGAVRDIVAHRRLAKIDIKRGSYITNANSVSLPPITLKRKSRR